MAWLDPRIWAHPKYVGLSDRAWRVAVSAIAYADGFGTRGRLDPGQQRVIGSNARIRAQLVGAGLWHEDGAHVLIHDWDEHNGKRDEKREHEREQARERKRRQRARERGEDPDVTPDVTPPVTRDMHRDEESDSPARRDARARADARMTGDRVTSEEEPQAVTSTSNHGDPEANGLESQDEEDPETAAAAWALVEQTAANLRSP